MLRRFDSARLRPVPLPASGAGAPGAHDAPRRCAASDRLVAACRLGTGPAAKPWFAPWEPARIEWPLGVFHVADPAVAHRAALQLDGAWAMADASAAGRLALRARALAADMAWWRSRADGDAWDAGTLPAPGALQGFRPRRATLVIVDGAALAADGARAFSTVLGQLERQASGWPQAVRVVVAGGPVPSFARPL
jgi:hypothetical protein